LEKRYQVFISSTFSDLMDERRKVIETIMQLDCFPAGMELFPAADEEQFDFIKKIIDDCDYYILIIGGRYGSENFEGISYTEKEYDYALETSKPILVFLHGQADNIPFGKTEDPIKLEKLERFKAKVSTNRLVKFWTNKDELPGQVALSLTKAIKMYPQVGWIRGSNIDNTELLQQLNQIRDERDKLKVKIETVQSAIAESQERKNLSKGKDVIEIYGLYAYAGKAMQDWSRKITWDQIFSLVGPTLFQPCTYQTMKSNLELGLKNYFHRNTCTFRIDDNLMQTIKVQLLALGLIDVYSAKAINKGVTEFISLTDKGKSYLLSIKTLQNSAESSEIVMQD
jgi:hypothetical protein